MGSVQGRAKPNAKNSRSKRKLPAAGPVATAESARPENAEWPEEPPHGLRLIPLYVMAQKMMNGIGDTADRSFDWNPATREVIWYCGPNEETAKPIGKLPDHLDVVDCESAGQLFEDHVVGDHEACAELQRRIDIYVRAWTSVRAMLFA